MSILRKNNYFFTFEISKIEKDRAIPKHVIKYITRFLFWRGKKIAYFEPFQNKTNSQSTVVIGSSKVQQTANRNVLIFILELYAHLNEPSGIQVTEDFKSRVVKVKDIEITIYKVKNFKK